MGDGLCLLGIVVFEFFAHEAHGTLDDAAVGVAVAPADTRPPDDAHRLGPGGTGDANPRADVEFVVAEGERLLRREAVGAAVDEANRPFRVRLREREVAALDLVGSLVEPLRRLSAPEEKGPYVRAARRYELDRILFALFVFQESRRQKARAPVGQLIHRVAHVHANTPAGSGFGRRRRSGGRGRLADDGGGRPERRARRAPPFPLLCRRALLGHLLLLGLLVFHGLHDEVLPADQYRHRQDGGENRVSFHDVRRLRRTPQGTGSFPPG